MSARIVTLSTLLALTLFGCAKKSASVDEDKDDCAGDTVDASAENDSFEERVPVHSNAPFPARQGRDVARPLGMDATILDTSFTLKHQGQVEENLKCVRGDDQELYGVMFMPANEHRAESLSFHCTLLSKDSGAWRLTWNVESPAANRTFEFRFGAQPELALAQVEVPTSSTTVMSIAEGASGALRVNSYDAAAFELKGHFSFTAEAVSGEAHPAFEISGDFTAQY